MRLLKKQESITGKWAKKWPESGPKVARKRRKGVKEMSQKYNYNNIVWIPHIYVSRASIPPTTGTIITNTRKG